MSLHQKLLLRQADGVPVRIGVVGAGKFGTMFLSQAIRIPGLHVAGIADLSPDQARDNVVNACWTDERLNAASIDAALQSGTTHVGDDAMALIAHPAIDIIVEATGNPIVAVDHILAAFAMGKDVVSATVEADALCGAALSARAEAAGVIYSMAFGDQPALVCELVDWARTCGFSVAAAGRGHIWRPEYRFSTPDTVWNHWGLSPAVAARGRLNPKMFNSFLDGTKPAIESAAIANACGLSVPRNGLCYPSGTIDDIPSLMRPRDQGGVLDQAGCVEVINSLTDSGDTHDYDIRMGVFVVVEADTEYQRRCLEEYKVTTDGSGRFFCLYKRWHLIGLELGMSVAQVAIRREATGTASTFRGDVVAVAKQDLAAGEVLDGEGGYTVAGQLRPAAASRELDAVPLGLTGGATMRRAVAADTILTYGDVVLDDTSNAFSLRRETETRVTG